jgi:hypothetical protein
MKKLAFVALFVIVLAAFAVQPAAAASGGMPAAHGVDGKTFGSAVSNLAQTNPAALADHVSGGRSGSTGTGGGGMPALHGVDGRTFGVVVSNLAQTDPAALAAHVSGR